MAKIFKVTGYFVDPNGEENSDRLETWFDEHRYMFYKHLQIEECDIGEWDDENPLNDVDSPVSECEQYFIKRSHKTAYETITTMPIDELAEFLVDCFPTFRKESDEVRQKRIQSMKQLLSKDVKE